MDLDTISIIVSAAVTIAAVLLGIRWQLAKNKLSEIRKLIDAVDDAIYDDSVNEEEFREIFQRLMTVVKQ